jgi:NitT/TauT family transport system substrate-binding protein
MSRGEGEMRVRKMTRGGRRFAALAVLMAALTAAVAFSGCGSGGKATRVVRVGFLRNDLHQLAYYVAREKGFFTEQGLDVREGGAFNAGPEEMSAFSAGDLDIGYVGAAPVVTFVGQQMADVKIVAQANQIGSSILLRPGLDAEDVTALKGRTIAIPGQSTVQDFLLNMALEKAGVDVTEVRKIVVKPPEMPTALASGQIDAAVVWQPYPAMTVAQNQARILENSQQIWPHHPCCMVVADTRFIDKDPDAVKRFVAAHEKATQYIRDNPLEAADMAHLYTGQPTDVARQAMRNIEFYYRPDAKKIQQYVEFMSQAGVIKEKDAGAFTRALIDTSFITGSGK